MNKTELISAIAEGSGLTKGQSGKALDAFINAVGTELQAGGKISIVGFGTFEVSCRASRTGRNPQTGEAMTISASKNVKFKAGKALKDRL